MPRPKSRPDGAKRLEAWLSPAAHAVLSGWQEARGYSDRTETLEAILAAVGRQLEGKPRPGKRERKPRLEDYPAFGHCEVCGGIQYESPSGLVCLEGHGGAPSTPPKPGPRHVWINGEWLDPADQTELSIIEAADSCRRTDGMTVEDVLGEQEEDSYSEEEVNDD